MFRQMLPGVALFIASTPLRWAQFFHLTSCCLVLGVTCLVNVYVDLVVFTRIAGPEVVDIGVNTI